MGHERSITIEGPGGWINAYGPGNETGAPVGQQLPGQLAGPFPTEPEASDAARRRSLMRQEGFSREEPTEPGPSPLAVYTPKVGSPEASRLNENLGLPEFSLTPTFSPTGSQGAVRGPSQDAVDLAQQREEDPLNRDLAAQEHEAFARSVAPMLSEAYGLPEGFAEALAPLILGVAVPGYQGAKWAAQSLPGGQALSTLSEKLGGPPLAGPRTTAPGMDQLRAGLAPLLGRRR